MGVRRRALKRNLITVAAAMGVLSLVLSLPSVDVSARASDMLSGVPSAQQGTVQPEAFQAERAVQPAAFPVPDVKSGKIIIHKNADSKRSNFPNEGLPLADPSVENPVKGAVFQIQKVNEVDLSTPEGWALVPGIKIVKNKVVGIDDAAYTLGAQQTLAPTGEDGITTSPTLERGLYVVTEVPSEGARVVSDGSKPMSAAQLLVTVPFRNRSGWLSDVTIYPQATNTPYLEDPELQVDTSHTFFPGDPVSLTTVQAIPNMHDWLVLHAAMPISVSHPLGKGIQPLTASDVTVEAFSKGKPVTWKLPAPTVNKKTNTATVDFGTTGMGFHKGDVLRMTTHAKLDTSGTPVEIVASSFVLRRQPYPSHPITNWDAGSPTVLGFARVPISVRDDVTGVGLPGAKVKITGLNLDDTVSQPERSITVKTGADGTVSTPLIVGQHYRVEQTEASRKYNLPQHEKAQNVTVADTPEAVIFADPKDEFAHFISFADRRDTQNTIMHLLWIAAGLIVVVSAVSSVRRARTSRRRKGAN
ncbi:MAG: pilin N-terminal domain-containing protein [Actinomycetaceae bacterium]|nr:hypothetical protein [Actinomycetaceae bacterium]MDY6083286.1 pilin N-terminal domain-containing protein [Actinomycetaceae bacterium]